MYAASLLPLSLLTTASALTVWVSNVVTETQYHSQEIQVIVDAAGVPWTTITKDATPIETQSLPSSSLFSSASLTTAPIALTTPVLTTSTPLSIPSRTSSTSSTSTSTSTSSTSTSSAFSTSTSTSTSSTSASTPPSHHSHIAAYNYIPNDTTSASTSSVTTSPEPVFPTSTSSSSSSSTFTPSTSTSSAASPTSASGSQFSGEATFYSVGLGACGVTNTDSELIAALNKDQWEQFGSMSNGNPACGKQARISYQGKSVTVTIQDKCPGCQYGDLDLSPAAFQQLADEGAGRIKMTWSFV